MSFASAISAARVYTVQGKYSEAEPLYLKVLEIAEKSLGNKHLTPLTIQKNWQNFRSEIEEK
ncbi:MAG: tetratricopeptide repeat protein [Hydrococcus sp. RM1_1_31]|nr:tetratricopeptide repeat protein [Hydrococcus sp. RM1_1_31]